jgi:SAM-dependent methyltransferase
MEPTKRFTNRVDNYVKFRPGYPEGMSRYFRDSLGIGSQSVIADVGSGTGISTDVLLDLGAFVYAVEPNTAMRQSAETFLEGRRFRSVDGSAEFTTLPPESVDFIAAGQAFHWFDRERTRLEFTRILRRGGQVVLFWNDRVVSGTPFLKEYEEILLRYCPEYLTVRHKYLGIDEMRPFFSNGEVTLAKFPNEQKLDFEGLSGRLLSSSYAPLPGSVAYEPMIASLKDLFDKNAVNGTVAIAYETNVFNGSVH